MNGEGWLLFIIQGFLDAGSCGSVDDLGSLFIINTFFFSSIFGDSSDDDEEEEEDDCFFTGFGLIGVDVIFGFGGGMNFLFIIFRDSSSDEDEELLDDGLFTGLIIRLLLTTGSSSLSADEGFWGFCENEDFFNLTDKDDEIFFDFSSSAEDDDDVLSTTTIGFVLFTIILEFDDIGAFLRIDCVDDSSFDDDDEDSDDSIVICFFFVVVVVIVASCGVFNILTFCWILFSL